MSSPILQRPLLSGPGGRRPPGKRRNAYEHFPHTIFIPHDFLAYNHYLLLSFSLTHIRPSNFYRTIFVAYDILAYDFHRIRYFSITKICHYEHYTVRNLSHTMFRHTNIFLQTFVIRTLSIRSFVRTPLAIHTSIISQLNAGLYYMHCTQWGGSLLSLFHRCNG